MKRYAFLDSKGGRFVLALFLLAQLFVSRDTLLSSCILGFTRSQLVMIALTALLALGFLIRNLKRLKEILTDRRMAFAIVASLMFLIPCVLKRDWQMMYLSMLFGILFAVLVSYFATTRDVARIFVALMTLLSLYSIAATYFLRRYAQMPGSAVRVFYNAVDVKFYNFIFAYVSESYVKNRNFGIFREPGVHQYFILLALYLNFYHAQWRKNTTQWLLGAVLSAAMITTLATGGYLELLLLAVVIFFEKKLYESRPARIAVIALLLAVAAALTVIFVQKGNLYWELYGMTVSKFQPGEESGADRIASIVLNLRMFCESPLLGAPLAQVLHAVENNTSSTLILFAVLGVFGGSLHVLGWLVLAWQRERGILGNLLVAGILFLSFNTQNLTANVFFWLMPTMALVEAVGRLHLKRKGKITYGTGNPA